MTSSTSREVRITLTNRSLWDQFHRSTTEMIVTKTGRKMFPKLDYRIEGLDPELSYGLALQMEQVDDNRYKFSGGEWSACGRGEVVAAARSIPHHDGVMKGSQWMRAPVQFERVKITNNPHDMDRSHVYLNSMHKYMPVVTVYEQVRSDETAPFLSTTAAAVKIVARSRFSCTEFIAVTAYQNERVKELKIEHNPYAKGFRDGGERKRSSPDSSSASPSDTGPSPKRLSLDPRLPLFLPSPHHPPALSSPLVPPMINPFWYNTYWNPYLLSPLLAHYRMTMPKQD